MGRMYVYEVWMRLRVFMSVWALYGEANALYWKTIKRQNSTHLTLLKHQNTKTALYKLPKNRWVIVHFWACQKQITCDSLFGSPCIMHYCHLLFHSAQVHLPRPQFLWGSAEAPIGRDERYKMRQVAEWSCFWFGFQSRWLWAGGPEISDFIMPTIANYALLEKLHEKYELYRTINIYIVKGNGLRGSAL